MAQSITDLAAHVRWRCKGQLCSVRPLQGRIKTNWSAAHARSAAESPKSNGVPHQRNYNIRVRVQFLLSSNPSLRSCTSLDPHRLTSLKQPKSNPRPPNPSSSSFPVTPFTSTSNQPLHTSQLQTSHSSVTIFDDEFIREVYKSTLNASYARPTCCYIFVTSSNGGSHLR